MDMDGWMDGWMMDGRGQMLEAIRATGKFFISLAILPVRATPLCRLQRQLCAACYRDVDPRRMDDAMEEHRHDIAAHLARRFFGDEFGGLPYGKSACTPPPRYGPRPVSSLHRLLGRIDGKQSKGRLAQLPSSSRHFSFFFLLLFRFVSPLSCGVACRSVVNCKCMALSNPLLADLRG